MQPSRADDPPFSWATLVVVALASGCGGEVAGVHFESPPPLDACTMHRDGGAASDAGVVSDAGLAMSPDAGAVDAAEPEPVLRNVTVGVGFGGLTRAFASDEGLESATSEQLIDSSLFRQANDDAVTSAEQVCLEATPWACYWSGYHSTTNFKGLAFGNGRFVAVGGDGVPMSRVSTDGFTWSEPAAWVEGNDFVIGNTTVAMGKLHDVVFNEGRFVAVSLRGDLFSSADGVMWDSDAQPLEAAWGQTRLRKLVALGEHGVMAFGSRGEWAYSADGRRWSREGQASDGVPFIFRTLSYDPVRQMLIGAKNTRLADGPPFNRAVFYSMDLQADEVGAFRAHGNIAFLLGAVIHVPTLSRYFAYANERVWTSENGLDGWNAEPTDAPLRLPQAVYFNPTTGTFTAQHFVFGTGVSEYFESQDGIRWTSIEDPFGGEANALVRLVSADVAVSEE